MGLHAGHCVSFALLLSTAVGSWPAADHPVGTPTTYSAEVPAGQSKSTRLSQLPRDAVVSIRIQTDGPLVVALLTQQDFRSPAGPNRPLFQGETSTSMTFSATVPSTGDYSVRLDNRKEDARRTVTLTTTGEARPMGAQRAAAERLKASERSLKAFELRLNLALVFKPVPIKIRACPSATSFARTETLVLCAAYVQRLHAAFPDGQQAADALLFRCITRWHTCFCRSGAIQTPHVKKPPTNLPQH